MILIVDDDVLLRQVLTTYLTERGFEVITAADGLSGVGAFREHVERIRLVVMDLEMPNLNGLEAYRLMRQIRSQVKVIVMSGFIDAEAYSQLRAEGIVHIFTKPFRPDELLNAMRSLLGEEQE